ncbi:hypothetical protein PS15m_001285 [Mucor circinelloides]
MWYVPLEMVVHILNSSKTSSTAVHVLFGTACKSSVALFLSGLVLSAASTRWCSRTLHSKPIADCSSSNKYKVTTTNGESMDIECKRDSRQLFTYRKRRMAMIMLYTTGSCKKSVKFVFVEDNHSNSISRYNLYFLSHAQGLRLFLTTFGH